MATNVHVPVALPIDSDDYITQYGDGTATVYLAYGTAATPADGTASTLVVSGTEQYEFWVEADADYHYMFRVGDGTDYTPWSATWQQPQAYCTVQEVVRGMDFPDESRYDELEGLCVEATDHITNVVCGGRSFFRDPVGSGESTKTFDILVPHQSVLSLARDQQLDIVSVSSLKVADYTGDTLTTVTMGTATGAYYVPDHPISGQPYSDIALSDYGTDFVSFPTGRRVVEVTGVFGWPAVPDLVRRATVDLVRFWWNSRQADGEPVGISAFGSPVFGAGMPKTVRDLGRSDYAWKDWVA